RHCVQALHIAVAVLGAPEALKTDNCPGYRSHIFGAWCRAWGIKHTFGCPENSQGQAVVACAHRT
ncbi:POK18 protein, partial [Odontophorus gujanensis]|nr:POK18 protein [Odontophorus gujanensis]